MSEVTLSGPLFDGRAIEAMNRGTKATEEKIAQAAADRARDILLRNIKVEVTGAEPASFHASSSSFGTVVTDDHGIKYGPWLEGTGSRNETTRFKGYHSVRQAADEIDARSMEMADEALRPYIEEMQ